MGNGHVEFNPEVAVPVLATTLSPFLYGHLTVQGGVATIPEVIGDRALAFALASALGWMQSRLAMWDSMDYRSDLLAMPYRTSVFTAVPEGGARLLPPTARRCTLDAEGGYQRNFYNAAAKGNFKDFWSVQAAAHGAHYTGAIFGFDPFAHQGEAELVIRIGSGRTGIVRLVRNQAVEPSVHLNASTAILFGRRLGVGRRLLNDLQISHPMSMGKALDEASHWTA